MSEGKAGSNEEDRTVLSRPERAPDRIWAYGADPDQIADVYDPVGTARRSTVVLVHGGFWRPEYDRVHVRPLAAHLADRGHLVVSLEYRRIPGDPDTTVSDLQAALIALSASAWRPAGPIQVVGHSAGGHLTLLLAQSAAILQSALALAPVADLEEAHRRQLDDNAVTAFLGREPASRPDLDPTRAAGPAIPVVVLHGADDSLVPVELSRAYAEHAAGDLAPTLIELDATGHFELIDPTHPTISIVDDALDRLTPTPGTAG